MAVACAEMKTEEECAGGCSWDGMVCAEAAVACAERKTEEECAGGCSWDGIVCAEAALQQKMSLAQDASQQQHESGRLVLGLSAGATSLTVALFVARQVSRRMPGPDGANLLPASEE